MEEGGGIEIELGDRGDERREVVRRGGLKDREEQVGHLILKKHNGIDDDMLTSKFPSRSKSTMRRRGGDRRSDRTKSRRTWTKEVRKVS